MKELQKILASQNRIQENGGNAVLATVVDVRGSSYRLPGAKMLISDRGETFGTVSGGCLEADVLERARRVSKTGKAEVFVYDTTSQEDSIFTLNMGCRGVIRILIEKAENRLFEFLKNCVEARQSGVIATLIEGDAPTGSRLLVSHNRIVVSDFSSDFERKILPDVRAAFSARKSNFQIYDFGEVFLEFIQPPLNMLVFGGGADAIPLVEFAKNLGWRVCVIEHRSAFATRERFPFADQIIAARPENLPENLNGNLDLQIDENSVAVVMTHNYEHDREILRFLLASKSIYIGILGPKRRTQNLLAELSEAGTNFTDTQLQKIYAPVGLDIGADTPETIALSIIAEIQSVLANRAGGFLRNREGSIYNR